MTLEQLAVFVAVAEEQHVTRAAAALGLTPSAVSASVRALEANHDVRLFDRVGRGIVLTREGGAFLAAARDTLARAGAAERLLAELAGLTRGSVAIEASQTIANYWLPPRLMRFRAALPGIAVTLGIGNTRSVADAVIAGTAELGFVEGEVADPHLAGRAVERDEIVAVVRAGHPTLARGGEPAASRLAALTWVMREEGSGTRSEFELALADLGLSPDSLTVALTLPSNEAVLSAVRAGDAAAALSRAVVAPLLAAGDLVALDAVRRPRAFTILRHRERRLSRAAARLAALCEDAA